MVYHCVQPPYTRWTQEFPALNGAVVDAFAAAGAKLVLADNLYRYGTAGRPLAENLPFAATDPKGRLRAALATQLLAAHEAGRLRVTLGLASDYFGPSGVDSGLGAAFFGRLVAGKRAQWIGRLDQPHAASYLPDVGRGLVTLGRRDEADGRAWHLPAAAPTGRELLRLTGEALGRPATAQVAPRALLRAVGVVRPMFRELAHVAYQWERPWVVDSTAYERAFGPAGPNAAARGGGGDGAVVGGPVVGLIHRRPPSGWIRSSNAAAHASSDFHRSTYRRPPSGVRTHRCSRLPASGSGPRLSRRPPRSTSGPGPGWPARRCRRRRPAGSGPGGRRCRGPTSARPPATDPSTR